MTWSYFAIAAAGSHEIGVWGADTGPSKIKRDKNRAQRNKMKRHKKRNR